jgi:hypothetical protein
LTESDVDALDAISLDEAFELDFSAF